MKGSKITILDYILEPMEKTIKGKKYKFLKPILYGDIKNFLMFYGKQEENFLQFLKKRKYINLNKTMLFSITEDINFKVKSSNDLMLNNYNEILLAKARTLIELIEKHKIDIIIFKKQDFDIIGGLD